MPDHGDTNINNPTFDPTRSSSLRSVFTSKQLDNHRSFFRVASIPYMSTEYHTSSSFTPVNLCKPIIQPRIPYIEPNIC